MTVDLDSLVARHRANRRKASNSKPGLSDEQMLLALHLRDVEHLTAGENAERLGLTKSTVIGALRRVDLALRQGEGDDCPPDNGVGNGTMAPLWWAESRI